MWSLWRSFSLANKIGLVGAGLGFAIGMAAVFVVSTVAGLVITTLSLLLVAFGVWFFFGAEIRRRHLLVKGTPSWATIVAVEETGKTVASNLPIARLRLLVDAPGGAPYEATTECLMDRFEIPGYQPGTRIQVVIDPRHRRKVAVA